MTNEQITNIARKYIGDLEMMGFRPEPFNDTSKHSWEFSEEEQRRHILWMCYKIIGFTNKDQTGKAFRWLGFIQGVLWSLGSRSIDNMRIENTS